VIHALNPRSLPGRKGGPAGTCIGTPSGWSGRIPRVGSIRSGRPPRS